MSRYSVRVADEVFLVVAYLHKVNPEAKDFSVDEILETAKLLHIVNELRPGFETHLRQHCVANKKPNPGNYRILFSTGTSRRRLLNPSDEVHPLRTGKQFPGELDVPPEYQELINWAQERFSNLSHQSSAFELLKGLRGKFTYTHTGQSVDDYVRELRADWE